MGKLRKGDKSGGSCVSTWHIDMLTWPCPVPHQHCLSCLLKFLHNSVLGEGCLCCMHVCFCGEAESSNCSGTMAQRGPCICSAYDWSQYGGVHEHVITIKDQARQVTSG